MGIFSSIAPEWALKRAIARQRLQRLSDLSVKRTSYESSTPTRLNYDFRAPLNSADSAIDQARSVWRQRVRNLETTEPFVTGPIKRIANNVVGQGFIYQSKAEDKELAKQIEVWFKDFSMIADMRRINTLWDLLRIAEMTLVRDGEVLLIGRESKYKHRFIPYCLQMVEVDRLITPKVHRNNPKVKDGIRYDDDDAPIEYYVLKQHPGNNLVLAGFSDIDKFDVIKADYDNGEKRVIHLFNPIRPEQSRGFTEFASSLEAFENLDKYTGAEIYAAIEDACLTGIVKSKTPDDFQQNSTVQDPAQTNNRLHEFGFNQMMYLNPDEDITIHAPTRPNSQLGEMISQLLRKPANALDIPPEILSQDFQGMNYSNARVVLLQFYHVMRIRQKYLIDHVCKYIQRNFVKSLAIHGKIKADQVEDALKHSWIPPGWQWVDPQKEAAGKGLEVLNKFDSISSIIASRGQDPDDVFEQIERDNERLKALKPDIEPDIEASPEPEEPKEEPKEDIPEEEDAEEGEENTDD